MGEVPWWYCRPWRPIPFDQRVLVAIQYGERELARELKAAGGIWRREHRAWEVPYHVAERLGVHGLDSIHCCAQRRRRMKKVLSAFMVLALALFGASRVAANEPHELPDAFLATLLQGKIGEAVDQYMATNPVLSEKKQQIQAVKSAIEGAFQIFGQPMGTEVVAVDDLAPSLRRFVFITKHASGPLTWEFYVYRARDSWIAVNLNFNDNFSLTAPRK